MSLLSESLIVSPVSFQAPHSIIYMKLSDCILKNPKSLSENNTKLSLVEKSINEIDNLHSAKLMVLETLYLSNNSI